ncbi:MAG: D-alanine--D-alanine ligase [Kiritimatiellia bacterium]|jgi:D-alanine-D-alanine ligase|nr:D-alanine--D-alanine ligase [Kiritimatiellia bacterium]
MKRIAVMMGGTSSERAVSLRSGEAVVAGLREAGFDAVPVVLDADRIDTLPSGVEAVFLALHGGYGENGGVQCDLDRLGLPYTGPGAAASRIAMDKIATKRVLEAAGVPTPAFEVLPRGMEKFSLPLPVVVKPPRDGSSVGVVKVTSAAAWPAALEQARARDPQGEVLVEAYIGGREWTVSVLDGEALPVVEIEAPGGWYGFTEKYTSGTTRYTFPEAVEDAPLAAQCRVLALLAYQAVGCRGVSRVDFRVTPAGETFVLEINTIPGFTATSLLPKAAARAGLSFPALCARLIATAACG